MWPENMMKKLNNKSDTNHEIQNAYKRQKVRNVTVISKLRSVHYMLKAESRNPGLFIMPYRQ